MLGSITDAYAGYAALNKSSHLAAHENHFRHGPVVRQGPNRLIFNSIAALQDIYLNPKVNKSHLYVLSRNTPKGNIFDTIDVDHHREKRKVVSQPIKEQAMRDFEPVMAAQIDRFLEHLSTASDTNNSLNMTEQCRNLAGDVIGQLAFGYDLELQNEEKNRWLLWGLGLSSTRINIYMQFPPAFRLEGLLRFFIRGLRKRYQAILATMIKSRVSMDKYAQHDLYSYAVDSMSVGTSMADSELWAEAFFFIVAGSSTATTAMSSVFFYLPRNPDCYARLAQEIRTIFDSVDDIHSGDKLRSCEYLRACINESLRMSPPNTSPLWREGVVKGGKNESFIVDGHVIPPGTQVGVNIYALHHNEEYFEDSFAYRPDRWLTASAKDPNSVQQKAFAPFIVGSRSCPGRAVAYLELSLTIAKTIFAFDFKVAPGEDGQVGAGQKGKAGGRGRVNEFQMYDNFTAGHEGPILVFQKRKV